MAGMDPRRLAAVDMYGTHGTLRRRRIVLFEFVGGLIAAVAFGSWLISIGDAGNAVIGAIIVVAIAGLWFGPELARNHALLASCEWGAGGMKWDVGAVTIRNAYVHDNDCKGLWADMNAHDAVIENSLIGNNRAEGIFYEISHGAVIRDNQVYRNGYAADGWYWDGGISWLGAWRGDRCVVLCLVVRSRRGVRPCRWDFGGD